MVRKTRQNSVDAYWRQPSTETCVEQLFLSSKPSISFLRAPIRKWRQLRFNMRVMIFPRIPLSLVSSIIAVLTMHERCTVSGTVFKSHLLINPPPARFFLAGQTALQRLSKNSLVAHSKSLGTKNLTKQTKIQKVKPIYECSCRSISAKPRSIKKGKDIPKLPENYKKLYQYFRLFHCHSHNNIAVIFHCFYM